MYEMSLLRSDDTNRIARVLFVAWTQTTGAAAGICCAKFINFLDAMSVLPILY